MKKNKTSAVRVFLFALLIFLCLSLFGCNESGKIWAKYSSEDADMTVQYEIEGERVSVRVKIVRLGEDSEVRAEFLHPDALRGARGIATKESCEIILNGLSLDGDGAARLMDIPKRLAFSEASSLGRAEVDGKEFVFADTSEGKFYFDAETGRLDFAELSGIRCEITENFRTKN